MEKSDEPSVEELQRLLRRLEKVELRVVGGSGAAADATPETPSVLPSKPAPGGMRGHDEIPAHPDALFAPAPIPRSEPLSLAPDRPPAAPRHVTPGATPPALSSHTPAKPVADGAPHASRGRQLPTVAIAAGAATVVSAVASIAVLTFVYDLDLSRPLAGRGRTSTAEATGENRSKSASEVAGGTTAVQPMAADATGRPTRAPADPAGHAPTFDPPTTVPAEAAVSPHPARELPLAATSIPSVTPLDQAPPLRTTAPVPALSAPADAPGRPQAMASADRTPAFAEPTAREASSAADRRSAPTELQVSSVASGPTVAISNGTEPATAGAAPVEPHPSAATEPPTLSAAPPTDIEEPMPPATARLDAEKADPTDAAAPMTAPPAALPEPAQAQPDSSERAPQLVKGPTPIGGGRVVMPIPPGTTTDGAPQSQPTETPEQASTEPRTADVGEQPTSRPTSVTPPEARADAASTAPAQPTRDGVASPTATPDAPTIAGALPAQPDAATPASASAPPVATADAREAPAGVEAAAPAAPSAAPPSEAPYVDLTTPPAPAGIAQPVTLATPELWHAPSGERSPLPLVLDPAHAAGRHRILLAGLERGAFLSHAVEIIEGTWLIEARDLTRARLERGPAPKAEAVLTAELRRVDGTLVGRVAFAVSSAAAGDGPR